MARNAIPTYVTGDLITAAHANTYWRDNEAAHWPFTTAGDMAYATAANALGRLALGGAGSVMRVNVGGTAPQWLALGTAGDVLTVGSAGNLPVWGGILQNRQGGDASDWSQPGSNNYSPTQVLIACGVTRWTGTAANNGSGGPITFSPSFGNVPMVLINPLEGGVTHDIAAQVNSAALNQFSYRWAIVGSGTETAIDFAWLAIGPKA